MKALKYTVLLLLLTPLFASAQSIPAFPMAFWGNVTINGSAAPVGTIVNAYYGSTLAGTVTVQDAGVYGYTDPTRQKLVIGEGTGPITFTFRSPSSNGGAETGGTTAVTYPQFTSGSTTDYDLAFTVAVPAPPSSGGGGGSSGGGGGGGGGGVTYSYGFTINGGAVTTATPAVTLNVTPTGNSHQMWVSNNSSFSSGSWVPFQSTYPWTLTQGIGTNTVYVRYGEASSTVATAQTSIQLTAPTVSNISTPVSVSTTTSTGVVLGASTYNFTSTLQVGSTGADVTALQNLLLVDGFSIPAGATGRFGAQTRTAVIAFQKAHGLAPVGVVGPLTRGVLNQGTIPTTPETTTTSTVSSHSLTSTQVQAILSLLQAFGADATTIKNVQAALR